MSDKPKRGRPAKSAAGAAVMVSVRLTPEVRDALRETAERLGVSQADVIGLGVAALAKRKRPVRGA